jgi:very-short-patch-repair endonuclease
LGERDGVKVVAMAKRPISDFKRKSANRLRANTTAAEQILWRHLRRLDVKGSHFRRQVVIGPYIADFACLAERLIVEVDGSQHGDDEGFAATTFGRAGCNRKAIE